MKSSETIKSYRNMKISEIDSELQKQNKELAVLKLEVAGRKNKNCSLVSKHKKNIARLLSLKNENKDK